MDGVKNINNDEAIKDYQKKNQAILKENQLVA